MISIIDYNMIIYQIFPDRFYKVDNNKRAYKNWNEKPTRRNHFGGNLKGIKEKIPYLKELGINAVYLTPIFSAPSTHKYDTQDYMKIDPNFGNLKDFDILLKTLHSNKIKLILDGVFNHTGDQFWAFKDTEEKANSSLYWNWYNIYGFPVKRFPKPNYDNAGIYYLPKLNHSNSEVVNYLKQVVKFWTSKGIDGWRFDMPWCIKPNFWHEIIKEIKNINPNIILIGEYWGKPEKMIGEYPFDGVMDYYFRENVINLLKNKINISMFIENLKYKNDKKFNLSWNMLGSHDTSRLRGMLRNEKKIKIAYLLQFTLPGIPVIYYGDEVGMYGGKDPDCRRTFNWDKKTWNMSIYNYIKYLCDFRKDINKIQNFKICQINDEKRELHYIIEGSKKNFIVKIDLKEYVSNIEQII